MRGLGRIFVLGVAAALIVWLLVKLTPDRPTTVQAPAAPAAEPATPSSGEDRALWRETVDRRLGR
ncbi:MAG: hypothetical protein MUF57_11395 [Gammaproteobacteria bacterium]|nr:hypothetical protein [Gammaproteobacteria bacterium]